MNIYRAFERKDIDNGSVVMFNYDTYDENGNKTGNKNGQRVRSISERDSITDVYVRIWDKNNGRYDWYGRKMWNYIDVYRIRTEDKRTFHKFIKKKFPNCEFKYEYNEMFI